MSFRERGRATLMVRLKRLVAPGPLALLWALLYPQTPLPAQTFWERAGLADSNVTSLNVNHSGKMVAGVNFSRMYVSSDSGTTWANIPGPSNLMVQLTALDEEGTIYVGDQDAPHGLQRTTDNGAHWTSIIDTTALGCNTVGIGPFGDVFATFQQMANVNLLYHSTDHGDTWTVDTVAFGVESVPAATPPMYPFDSQNHIFTFGRTGFIDEVYRSIDSGTTWTMASAGLPPSDFRTLCISSDTTLYVSGTYTPGIGSTYRSTNDGKSWVPCDTTGLPAFTMFSQLVTDLKNNVYGIDGGGSGAGVYRSTDAGHTWSDVTAGLNSSGLRYSLVTSPSGALFCATQVGLYKSTQALTSVRSGYPVPSEVFLAQNYPNPFNPSTVIHYSIPVETYNCTSLRVYDILGREVAVLVNERKAPGNYEVKFDGSRLTSGMYFYQLRAGDFVETKRLLLLK